MRPLRARESDESSFKSNNLWVGSLSTDTAESEIVDLFGRFGEIVKITAYSSRGFAFLYFRRVEEAVAAKEALQGTNFNGSHLKIEYARTGKPCKSLWVGGIGSSVSKEEVEAEFRNFGKIEDFRFLRERRTAFVDYFELEDAMEAAKSMNGKRVGGSFLRVDFQRSQAPRKEPWPGSNDSRGGHLPGRDGNLNVKQQYDHSFGDGQLSNVLWIGYPPSVQIDEQMLHNAMILFGEIERIKSFPSRHFSLIEFRSVEEARHAKEGLQGRLFSDPRISIEYSTSELPPGQEDGGVYSGARRSRPEMFTNDPPPFISSPSGTYGLMGPTRAHMETRDWRRRSPPGAGILPLPAQGMRLPMRPTQLDRRETKRARRDVAEDVYPPVGIDNRSCRTRSDSVRDSDHIWRGVIAKGGTPVCHARCVPIGNVLEAQLPEVVNCSARTGLDVLAKHYAEAVGFDIVFFLPDSEDDFASYTEFLNYLGSNNRAGVAKLDDGATLFLVPPSEFLSDILNVSGPERLYGVVLKMPQQPNPAASSRQESQSFSLSREDQAPSVSLTPALITTLSNFFPLTSVASTAVSITAESASQPFQQIGHRYNPGPPLPPPPVNNYAMYSQNSQQYQPEAHVVKQNYGAGAGGSDMLHGYQTQSGNVSQPQAPMVSSSLAGSGGTEAHEEDKNQRYQSTLEFAANLLQQIQQRQSDTAARQGTSN